MATPLPFTLTVPKTVVPSLNVTEPVKPLPEAGVTVAVKVTFCPEFDGFGDEVTAVLVVSLLTVRVPEAVTGA